MEQLAEYIDYIAEVLEFFYFEKNTVPRSSEMTQSSIDGTVAQIRQELFDAPDMHNIVNIYQRMSNILLDRDASDEVRARLAAAEIAAFDAELKLWDAFK